MQSNRRADERRRAGMQPSPTQDEAKEAYQERLQTLDNPETPSPTQAEADAMKTGTYEPAPEGETTEAREAREKRQRDMQPTDPSARYTTR